MNGQPQPASAPPYLGRRTWKDAVAERPWLWATVFAFALTSFIVFGLRPFLRHVPPPPEVLVQLPEFALVDQRGAPFGSADLSGGVWVADFFFTSCPSICAELTRKMGQLQEAFEREGVDARLVSISVDPHNDTPARLAEYARAHGADPARWTFLTGEEAAVRSLVIDGFKTHLGDPELTGKGVIDIAHASYFILVDDEGGIRGFFNALDDEDLSRAFHETRNLVRHLQQERRRER